VVAHLLGGVARREVVMRHLFGFLCVCALGLMPLIGCETAGNGGTGGTAGAGGTAGGGGSAGGLGTFTNAGTCAGGGEVGIDCLYGCYGLGGENAFEMILNVDPAKVAANSAFDVTFSGEARLPSGIWVSGKGEPPTWIGFDKAEIDAGATIPVTVLSGATGEDVVLTMEEIVWDSDANPVPIVVPILSGSGSFDAGASGTEACFNFANSMQFRMVVITEMGGSPTSIPVNFECQPANQEDLNADPIVSTPEADAGQVCFTIP